ncbi:MAG: hypothetical protein ABJP70_11775 [Erythrobacter sp.]
MASRNLNRVAALLVGSTMIAACSSEQPDGDVVTLQPGEHKVYSFDADKPMMVSFSHEGDSDTALACQGARVDPMAFPLPNCAGVYQSDGTGIVSGGTYAKGLHGAGIGFEPVDGKITVALKNISKIPLDLSIEAEPAG